METVMWVFVWLCGVGLCITSVILWGNLLELNQQVERLEADARKDLAEIKRREHSEAALRAKQEAKPKIVKSISMRMMVK